MASIAASAGAFEGENEMTIDLAKQLLSEFDRLNLETVAGINLLDEVGLISNLVVDLGDVANEDVPKCLEFLENQAA